MLLCAYVFILKGYSFWLSRSLSRLKLVAVKNYCAKKM